MAEATPPDQLPADKAESLKKFRENLSDVLEPRHNDYYLMRWLRARNWHLAKAEKMLRESLSWRKEIGADTILQDYEPKEVLVKYFAGGQVGFSKEGHPVWVTYFPPPPHTMDLKGLLYSVHMNDFIKYQIWIREGLAAVCEDQTNKLGKNIESILFVHDVEGFSLSMMFAQARSTISKVMPMIEANYPETMKFFFVINAPRVFPIMFNIVKPFLSEDSKSRIKILGSDWKEVLLEHIEADQLPVHWGGTMTGPDGDEFASDKVCIPGPVPRSYYLKDQIPDEVREKMMRVCVSRGSSLQLGYDVTKENTLISWIFETDSHDIGFGVFLRTDDEYQSAKEMQEVLPSTRLDSHMVPEEGHVTCSEAGHYVLRFDNTYSWMTSKTVHYFIEVIEPDQETEKLQHREFTEKPDSENRDVNANN